MKISGSYKNWFPAAITVSPAKMAQLRRNIYMATCYAICWGALLRTCSTVMGLEVFTS